MKSVKKSKENKKKNPEDKIWINFRGIIIQLIERKFFSVFKNRGWNKGLSLRERYSIDQEKYIRRSKQEQEKIKSLVSGVEELGFTIFRVKELEEYNWKPLKSLSIKDLNKIIEDNKEINNYLLKENIYNYTFINKENKYKIIPLNELDFWLSNGWKNGIPKEYKYKYLNEHPLILLSSGYWIY